jgi:hypothetical protein
MVTVRCPSHVRTCQDAPRCDCMRLGFAEDAGNPALATTSCLCSLKHGYARYERPTFAWKVRCHAYEQLWSTVAVPTSASAPTKLAVTEWHDDAFEQATALACIQHVSTCVKGAFRCLPLPSEAVRTAYVLHAHGHLRVQRSRSLRRHELRQHSSGGAPEA